MFLEDFIYVGENAFSNEFCDNLVKDFESLKSDGKGFKGLSGSGDDNKVKNSYDMNVMFEPELQDKYQKELVSTFNHLFICDCPIRSKGANNRDTITKLR